MNKPTENKPTKKKRRESVKLDETVKLLFEVSKDLLVTTLNSLFNESFDADSVTIEKTATEYPKHNFDIIRADMFLKVTDNMKSRHYHIEIQTEPDGDMIIRMFEYDLQKALDIYRLQNTKNDIPLLCMPKSLVIHIEDGGSVPESEHRACLMLADGTLINYTVPVMRYFEYDTNKLIKENLYTLLPLQLYSLRAELDKLTENNDEQAKKQAVSKAIALTEKLTLEVVKLYDGNKFDINDLDKIISALNELYRHLKVRYDISKEISGGVDRMIKTMYDERVAQKAEKQAEKRKAVEIATEMLIEGEPIEKIIKYTKLTETEVKEIQKTS